jgi:ferredoxin
VKIVFDSEKCQGHGRCYSLGPDVYDSDDEGYAVVKIQGEVPAELEEQAQLGADNCPEFAIEIQR